MSENKAKLNFDSKAIDLPIYQPSLGQQVIDVSSLGAEGAFTFDPGFMATASCESKITFINGGEGILLYRGYPIEQLAKHSDFLEVCYLLLHGELPSKTERESFNQRIAEDMSVDPIIINLFKGFSQDAHPMAILTAILAGLSGLYHDQINNASTEDRIDVAIKFIAKMPTIAAMCHRHARGENFLAPRNDLNYAENFMYMLHGNEGEEFEPNPVLCQAMDTIFTLHADHEQNASTSTVRLAGSTGTDPFAAMAAGAAALWGPAHGGANEAALNMLRKIEHIERIPEFIEKAKDKNDPFRLMGFGHRVYKNFDPRANVMREICHSVLEEIGAHDDETFKVAMELEKIAREDQYFIDRKLYPNVDFYSGITQSALGIPSTLFTVIFALGRSVGWASHWHEMLSAPFKIGRPRQLYTGSTSRDYPSK